MEGCFSDFHRLTSKYQDKITGEFNMTVKNIHWINLMQVCDLNTIKTTSTCYKPHNPTCIGDFLTKTCDCHFWSPQVNFNSSEIQYFWWTSPIKISITLIKMCKDFNKDLKQKQSPRGVLQFEVFCPVFCKISKNTFFHRIYPVRAY